MFKYQYFYYIKNIIKYAIYNFYHINIINNKKYNTS
jgi:hypothetical protein